MMKISKENLKAVELDSSDRNICLYYLYKLLNCSKPYLVYKKEKYNYYGLIGLFSANSKDKVLEKVIKYVNSK